LTVRVSEIVHLPLRALETLFDAERDDDAFSTIIRSIRDVFVFDQAVVLESAGDAWQCAAALPHELSSLPWLRGPFFDEVAAGRICATCDSHELQEWREVSRALIAPAQPALYLPMRVHGHRGLLILLRSTGKDAFNDADITLARQFALIALAALAARGAQNMESELSELRSQITRHKQVESDLARRAYTDDLTGLANRAMIQERVDDILRAGAAECFALAFIDLDNFKHINDYYNHAVGDALLVRVARRIAELVRETDMLARISGDEFLMLVQPIENDDQVRAVVENLLEKLKQPFHVEGFEMFTSASIGVSIYPEHGRTYEELRRNADSAMYRAKSGAKGAAAFFDVAVGQAMSARMELEQRLRLAIRDRQFCCAFQPKVDIRSQEVVGFETLVRWRDNEGEIHSPLAFIGLATELGVIDPITHFVLDEAIRSIDLLDDAFGAGKAIAINVAAKQAGDLRFMRSFVDALEASGCAERFIVEVTEDAFIAKNQFQMQVLPMLRDVGARVSIDDFGTGYSSLSVLADITADEIKIDRSFITEIHQRPRSQSVLKAMESVSSALGMSVVAEGVETFEELAYLLGATRIRYAQGYHFAKPFFLEEVARTNGARGDERVIAMERWRPESRPVAAARAAAGMRRD
jgi:diguanylate cyclase (GGDEF)-like protein